MAYKMVELNKEAAEKGYAMTDSEWYARLSWEQTCKERDDLKNEVKALAAAKNGLANGILKMKGDYSKVIEKLKQELKFHNAMKQAEKDRKKRIANGVKTEESYAYEQNYINQLEKAVEILESYNSKNIQSAPSAQ